MAKRRLYELAKARGLSSAELLEALKTAGVEGKSALSTMEEGDVDAALKKAGVDAKPQPEASENGQGPAPAEPADAWLLGGGNFGSHSQNAATVTSRPLHAQNVRRGPSFRSYVATVKGSKIGIYHSPTDPAPYTRLPSPNGDGARVAFLVKKLEAKWAYVYLPT